ncbi:hypothetical protein AB5J62_32915 [Amycolatopsis sp. cg5]|uniref:hypothetical protein n=1 Tax=Amycolatopsis sp. cg5 TaxID=3238802 RepID=UPI0035258FFD
MSRAIRAGLVAASAIAGMALATAPAQATTTQTQINQCGYLPIPAGWIDTGHFYSSSCGSSITLNTFVLVLGSSVPVGSQLTMCATTQYQPPAGWVIVSGLYNQPSCATFSPTLDKNAYVVRRFS